VRDITEQPQKLLTYKRRREAKCSRDKPCIGMTTGAAALAVKAGTVGVELPEGELLQFNFCPWRGRELRRLK
jgi:hypothetical protein